MLSVVPGSEDPAVHPDTPLDVLTGYLLIEAGQRAKTSAEDAVAALGLRPRHVRVLALFDSAEPGSQQEVSRILGLDPNIVVDIVDDLERLGFATRQRNPRDRRRQILVLTEAGQAALRAAYKHLGEAEELFFSSISAEEKAALHSILSRLTAEG